MGNVKFVVGRSGSGKTAYCIENFVRALREKRKADGKTDAFLIVPEQFAVSYERKVLSHPECKGLLGSEIISFNRLAHRIIQNSGEEEFELITPAGKAMLLVEIVRRLDSENKLSYYKRCAGNAKSITGILETLSEFSKYCVSAELIERAAEKSSTNDALYSKLSELALIYRSYTKSIEERYNDMPLLIKKAAEKIKAFDTVLNNAVVWIDGFSGFTEAELLMVNAFADTCAELNICLFYDEKGEIVFSCPNTTVNQLTKRFVSLGHTVETVNIGARCGGAETGYSGSRYENAPALGYLEENYARIKTKKNSSSSNSFLQDKEIPIKIFSCIDSYQEIENCADIILKSIAEGYKCNEIAVVSSNLDDKAALFRAVFSKYGIPYFLDNKRELSGHPVIRFILSFFSIISEDMLLTDVFDMLKTGLYKAERYGTLCCIDVLENKALSLGVNSARTWKRMCDKFNASYDGKSDNEIPEYVKLANDIYQDIYGENGFASKIKYCKTVRDCCSIVFDFAEESGLEISVEHIVNKLKKEGLSDIADTYLRVWNVFSEVCLLAESSVGDINVNGYKKLCVFFKDVISAAVSTYKVGFIPYTHYCVQIGNADRSRYLDKKIVFVIGANEGSFPSKFVENGILGDKEREVLKECGAELAYDSIERTYFAQFNVYSVLTSPSMRLFLSYSSCDLQGKAMFPSPCIASVLNIFPSVNTETVDAKFSQGEIDSFYEADTDVRISPDLAAKLLKIDSECKMSVSKLEAYKRCPYDFFLQQCLKLRERDLGVVKNTSVGTYFHGLIERASKDSRFKPGRIEQNVLKNMVREAAKEYFDDPENAELRYIFENSAKNIFLKDRIDEFAETDIKNIAEIADATGFIPLESELCFGMNDDDGLPPVRIECNNTDLVLRGCIDRIDVRELPDRRELCIVDYKSSEQKFDIDAVKKGVKLQLLTYLYAVSENKAYFENGSTKSVVPSAVLYYVFGKDTVSFSSDKNATHTYSGFSLPSVFDAASLKDKKSPLRGIKEAEINELTEVVKDNIKNEFSRIASGDFSITPDEDVSPCKWCKNFSICKYPKPGKS